MRSRLGRNISNLCVKSKNTAKTEHCGVQSIEPEPLHIKAKVPIVRERLVKTSELKHHGVINIGVARIFVWGGAKSHITCNGVIRNFERGIFCGVKDIVEWKIRSRGVMLARN